MLALIKGFCIRFTDLVVTAFLPATAYRKADCVWKRRVVVSIHVLFVLLVIGGLAAIQAGMNLDVYVRSSLPLVRALWLPIVGVIGYATIWSAWFVARTLRQADDKPLFDSVATSLRDGLERFRRLGIDPGRTPLYLVLGAPAGGIREYFASAHVDLAVLPLSEEIDEPIQVCGNRDAIYICCRDSSLVGHYARRSAQTLVNEAAERSAQEVTSNSGQVAAAWRSGAKNVGSIAAATRWPAAYQAVNPSGIVRSQNASAQAVANSSPLATLDRSSESVASSESTIQRVQQTLSELESITTLEASICKEVQPTAVLQPRKQKPKELRLDATEAEQLLERLETVCREIVAMREPYCPINGVIVMISLPACDTTDSSDHVGMRLERDLKTIAKTTDTHLSVQVIFSDLELCEGSQPFLDRFPENQRHRRLGAVIPASPSSEPESALTSIDQAVQWICDELFPPLGYRLMSRDLQDAVNDREMCMNNHRIQRLVQQMRGRREGMSRMLRRSIAGLGNQIRIRGCFLAATGMAGLASKQAFCEGVVPIILDMQNEVQWSNDRRAKDRWQQAVAVLTYGVVVAIAVTTVAMAF